MKLDCDTDQGFAARARLGLIVLAEDETLEPECARMTASADVALYHSRIPMPPQVRPDTLVGMADRLPEAAGLLPRATRFDAIGYGCTSASAVIGSDAVARAIRSACPGAAVTDPLAAIIAAGRALAATRLGFVTPYLPEVSARLRDCLEQADFTIAGFGSFEQGDDRTVARITPDAIAAAALRTAEAAPCDAIVISCTNLRCLSVIGQIEAQTSLPVIASNPALTWHMLRLSGLPDRLPQFGRLFTTDLAIP